MKLNELYSKSMKDVLEDLTMTDLKVHTNDKGEISAVELKYVPVDGSESLKFPESPMF